MRMQMRALARLSHRVIILVGCSLLVLFLCHSFSNAFTFTPRKNGYRSSLSLPPTTHRRRRRTSSVSPLLLQQTRTEAGTVRGGKWYPRKIIYDDDIFSEDDATAELEEKALQLAADLVRKRWKNATDGSLADAPNDRVMELVRGRFMDLTCTDEGEQALENLFGDPIVANTEENVIRGAIMVLQSLCAMGTQVGVKGSPEQLRKMVAHLDSRYDPSLLEKDLLSWDRDSVRRLKYRVDRTPAVELLAKLRWKRNAQGAFDLLVSIGAWKKHEDLALLRSGFPLQFTADEIDAAREAFQLTHDPDEILGLRRDLRELKVYTIDSALAVEIDDGLSVEVVQKEDGTERHRIWIHIADADRWAPRNSTLFEIARKRVTSLYLPTGPISMFPSTISTELMSLKTNRDTCALSLSVELNDDGSIEAVNVTPSLIRVSYRLTYDDVDEMLEEGTGYSEEWQLGALLDAATKRRNFRVRNGSSEGKIPKPIPYATVSTYFDRKAPDNIGISLNVQVSHNAGRNRTVGAEVGSMESSSLIDPAPVSSANLLVTEMMILAGEAMGQWKLKLDDEITKGLANQLRLPFRTQPKPDNMSRSREERIMMNLLEYNIGDGLCHAWYSRRFLQSVKVMENQKPHSGLGLDSYVQWTSPIRRFSDLQVHASVKRYLRRRRVNDLINEGFMIPAGINSWDLGWPSDFLREDGRVADGSIYVDDLDIDMNFLEGIGLVGAARKLQRQSQQYWLFEYVRRLREKDPDDIFNAVILGCVDPEKNQYAIYVYELGMEHRYTSPPGRLDAGTRLHLKVDNVSPRNDILTFVRIV